MRIRATLPVLLLVLAAACDGSITEPSFLHLKSVTLAPTFSCGIDGAGHAYCWGGDNAAGQLGNGSNTPSAVPVRVRTGARFLQVATGSAHACGLTTGHRILCWGDNNASQIGVTTTDLDCNLLQSNGWVQDFGNSCSIVPVEVQTTLTFVQVAAAGNESCGRTGDGVIWCWGASQFYTGVGLGDSAVTLRSDSLIRVSSPVPFTTFALGEFHGCASDRNGQGWCWGYNGAGELGRGTLDSLDYLGPYPKPINSTAFIKHWAIGRYHTCALTGAGEALCWGAGSAGQRGDSTTGEFRHDPTFVNTTRKFSAIVAASNSTCALELGTGTPYCWGENSSGQLGDGTTSDLVTPTKVLGDLSFSALAMRGAGYPYVTTTCGVTPDQVYCWGLLPQPLTFGE